MSFYNFLLFTLFLSCALSQTCQNVQDISSLMQSGKVQVFNAFNPPTTLKNRFRTFDIPIQYQIPSSGFQIAASISSSIFTSFFNNSLDFTVRGGRSSIINVAQIALFITEDSSWTLLDLSYLATSRNDLYIGSFIAEGYIFQNGESNLLTINYGIPNFVASNGQVTVIAQLAGLRTIAKSNLLFSFANTTSNINSGVITIAIQTNLPLQMLFLNYYWWNNNPSITFAEFNIDSGTFVAYSLAGINKINGSQFGFTSKGVNLIGFLQCNGVNCPKACMSRAQCQNSRGFLQSSSCYLCGTGQRYREDNCDNINNCKAKQYFNGISCDCIQGYQKVNSLCMPVCGNNAYVDVNMQCQCLPKEIIKGKNNKNSNQNQNKKNKGNNKNVNEDCLKIKICSRPNQILVDGNCTCEDGFALVNGNCVPVFSCRGGSIWNSATYSCVCPQRQFFINGNCSKCPNNSFWNGVSCICNSGFIFSNGACLNCPLNSRWNGFSCICDSGFILINGICSKCPQNSLWNGAVCKCQSGYFLINGLCTTCPSMSIWVQSQNSCICVSGYFFINGTCATCPINSGWNGNSCICLSGYYLINGLCSSCPANSGWNGTTCACLSGYYLQQKSCISCPSNSNWNGATCVCLNGWYLLNGSCLKCEAGFIWNGAACACPEESYLSNNKCIKCRQNQIIIGNKCVCITNYYQVNEKCQKLPENSYYNGTNFVCNANYYWIQNNCKKCGDNQVWNGKKCQCINNFYLIKGVCASCTSGMIWNGSACACPTNTFMIGESCQQCGPNSAWKGTSCQCLSNFYLINGVCASCTSGMIWNGSACACPTNTFMIGESCQQCGPNSAWKGTSCQCLANYYLSNNLCITCPLGTTGNGSSCISTCPSNSSWNGSSCVCDPKLFMINNQCLPCDLNSFYNISLSICTCNPGFYGDYRKCNQCSQSCLTCKASGPNMCLTCSQGHILANGDCIVPNNGCGYGKTKINNICQSCPQNCLTCKDTSTCSICQSNYTLLQIIKDKNSILGCTIPLPPSASSVLSLKGAVVSNGVLYQGVALSTLPTYFLVNNCNDCNDLFTITITPGALAINYSVEYVLYSQYWFIISFNYAGILPQFDYKVQINKKYTQYFTQSDLAQVASASANSIKYPQGNNETSQTNSIKQTNLSGSQLKPNTLIKNSQNNKGNQPETTREVLVSDGASKTYPVNTIVSLFS